jgi:plastocyanin
MDTGFKMTLVAVLVLAVAIGILTGRAQSQSTAASAPPPAPTPLISPAPGTVHIVSDSAGNPPAQFSPAVLTVHVGEKVTWINDADSDNTATADNGAFNSDVMSSGQSYSWTPKKTGRYTYSCFIHANMHGVIDVKP